MSKPNNLIGQKFGMLTVVERGPNSKAGKTKWVCRCDCGKIKERPVLSSDLKSGAVRSCGCMYKESNKGRNITHGMTNTRIWSIWNSMLRRCRAHPRYKHISVCDEWYEFVNFMKWANENGYRDDLTIDRINNSGNYEPANCRWATYKVQENNRSNNRHIVINGIDKTLSEWAEEYGISAATLRSRIKCGWPESDWFMPVNLANASIRKRMGEDNKHAQ